MTYEQIIGDLENKIYYPIYFLMGEEPYYIDQVVSNIDSKVLAESEKDFNQTVLYGKDVDVSRIVSEAKRYPMMANHNVVIVKEAQHVLRIEDLATYVESPLQSTVLVICYRNKKLDKRKKLYKLISKSGVLLETKKLYDNQVPTWIDNYVKSIGYSIKIKASSMMADFLGNDLNKIVNEIEKITIVVPKGNEITPETIEANIGISKDFNNFELNNAIGTRDVLKVNQIIKYFSANPKEHPFLLTVITLFNFFSQLLMYHSLPDKSPRNIASVLGINPFFVKDYQTAAKYYSAPKVEQVISYLRDADAKVKGVGNISLKESDIAKELIYKILH